MAVFYKITPEAEWRAAQVAGVYAGSSLDLKDGFIHLSTMEQVRETAALHFAGQAGLVLVALPEVAIAPALKWEASRGGKLFPHVFSVIDPHAALWVKALLWNGTAHDFPAELPA